MLFSTSATRERGRVRARSGPALTLETALDRSLRRAITRGASLRSFLHRSTPEAHESKFIVRRRAQGHWLPQHSERAVLHEIQPIRWRSTSAEALRGGGVEDGLLHRSAFGSALTVL